MERLRISIAKRLMDIVFSTAILLFSAPLMLFMALVIKLTSKGPVFYKQRRMGMLANGRRPMEFDVYKFRTMSVDAEARSGAVQAAVNDVRVTGIGRFLRKTRLDELPQMLNVLKGEMSIVGPRPERPELMASLAHAIPFFEERLRYVKPGITGLAQVTLQYDGEMGKGDKLAPLKSSLVNPFGLQELDGAPADGMRLKMLYDLSYSAALERFTSFLKTDLGIILKTPFIMFVARTGR